MLRQSRFARGTESTGNAHNSKGGALDPSTPQGLGELTMVLYTTGQRTWQLPDARIQTLLGSNLAVNTPRLPGE